MILLSATNLTKSYGVDPVLTEVSFHINKGDRIGIVGANGAGKTTLLNMLPRELSYDTGDFFLAADTTVGYLRQKDNFSSQRTVYQEMLSIFQELIDTEEELTRLSQEISRRSALGEDVEKLLHQYDDLMVTFENRNGYGYKSEISGILSSMAFSESVYDKPISQLSGGERTRLALAALLLEKPDLLLLDEPTNHLDIGTLKWLEQYLKAYTGTIVLISHDRYFLDQTVNRIFEVENHKLTVYEGNYSEYTVKKRLLEEDAVRHYEKQQEEIRRQEDIIRKFKERGTEKLAKRAQSREKRLAHVERLDRPELSNAKMRIRFKENQKSGTDVLYAEDLSKSFPLAQGVRHLFSNVSFDIKRGERICLVGPNGIGKTSLLKMILGELTPDTGRVRIGHNVTIGYYDQQQEQLSGSNTVLDELHNTYRLYSETELRSLLGRFLFRGDDVKKTVSALSGGEKARLALLKMMMSGSNLLLMDEPTNHLDIAAKEVFEDSLMDFPGTLFVVSHDRYFLNRVPTRIFELTESGITTYLGGYDYYVEKKQSIASTKGYLDQLARQTPSAAGGEEAEERLSEKEKRMEARRLEKEQQAQKRRLEKRTAELEAEIAGLEEQIALLEGELCKEEVYTDFERSARISEELAAAKASLEQSYDSWMSLHEE